MDKIDRRDLLKTSVAASAALIAAGSTSSALAQSTSMVKPARLIEGDTVMIVAPAGVEYNKLRLKLSIA